MSLLDKFQSFSQHRFVKQAATLQAGNITGNFIQALIGVFLARLLQPELFGIYTIAISLGSLAALFIGFGAFNATASLASESYAKGDHDELREILGFLVKIVFLSGLIAVAYIFMLPWIGFKFYNSPIIGIYAGVIVLALLVSSTMFSFLSLCLQLVGKIKTLAKLVVSDQALRYGFSLLLVFGGFGVWGAVSGQLAGAIILFVISVAFWKYFRREFNIFPSLFRLLKDAKRAPFKKYFSFTFWVTLDRNMGNVFMTIPVVLAGVYIATDELTFFKLAFGYINLSMSMLGPISTLLNIEFPKMKAEDSKGLARNFMKVSIYSMILTAVLTTCIVLIAPFAFKILYGESFLPSVKYVTGLFLYGALYGIGVGLGPMWRAVNKVKVSILINTIILAVGIPAGLLLIKFFGAWGAVIMVTLWFTTSHFISFIYLSKKLKSHERI